MRSVVLLALAAALAGCTTTTHVVDRTDAAAVAAADAALHGRHAVVSLVSGVRAAGTVEYVRVDSTAWTGGGRFQAVPTSDVFTVVADNRARSVGRGALIGLGVGLGVAAVVVTALDTGPDGDDFDLARGIVGGLVVLIAPPAGASVGAVGGALVGRRVEVVFEDRPPGPSQ
jgi:hypothetical protein